jgi:N-methylhydantoinase A
MAIAAASGRRDLVTFDMGGTSCDVALVVNGRSGVASRSKIGGRDLAIPMLDIHTVSAGGGTTARVEGSGADVRLAVGPRSAGARPGPVAYGLGGTEPTITDAHLVLGTLGPDTALGGRVRLDRAAASAAITARIARPLGLSVEDAAAGILRIIDVQMAEAIRAISTRRGHDLRGFTLVAFGGAGPLHAARLARDLGIREVLVPPHPGATSASGLLMADVRHDRVRSRLVRLTDARPAELETLFAQLESDARAGLRAEGFSDARVRIERSVDFRYAGQGYELTVPIDAGIDAAVLARLRPTFDAEHERQFGHAAPDRPVELLSFRVAAIGLVEATPLPTLAPGRGSVERAVAGERTVQLGTGEPAVRCRVYDRTKLAAGDAFSGPAVIEQLDSTTLVLPGQDVRVLEHGELLIAAAAEPAERAPSLAMAGGHR